MGYAALVDLESADLINGHGWHARKSGDGLFYAFSSTAGLMHRLIAETPVEKITDHANRHTLDNRRCNLRPCNHSQNNAASPKSPNRTGYRGVNAYRGGRRFVAQIRAAQGKRHLGMFATAEAAARAYDAAAIAEFGAFARLNFPEAAA